MPFGAEGTNTMVVKAGSRRKDLSGPASFVMTWPGMELRVAQDEGSMS